MIDMIVYSPYSTTTPLSLRQDTIDFLSVYSKSNPSNTIIQKDCTDSIYLYEKGFCELILQYPDTDMIIIEHDTLPTDTIIADLKNSDADLTENAYSSNGKSVIYAFGICKIKSNVLNSYIQDKKADIIPKDISWIKFYDIFYAWYNGLSYENIRFYKKSFSPIAYLNKKIAKHNKA